MNENEEREYLFANRIKSFSFLMKKEWGEKFAKETKRNQGKQSNRIERLAPILC